MLAGRSFRSLILPGMAVLLAISGCRCGSTQTADSPVAPSLSSLKQIHIDPDCQVLADRIDGAEGLDEPALEHNPVVCHLESIFHTQHVAETIHGSHVERRLVTVWEQTYVLQDVMEKPVQFLIEQPVPAGWRVDSYPPPAERIGSTAIFRVTGNPGQVVRLHVGEEFSRPLASTGASAGPQS